MEHESESVFEYESDWESEYDSGYETSDYNDESIDVLAIGEEEIYIGRRPLFNESDNDS